MNSWMPITRSSVEAARNALDAAESAAWEGRARGGQDEERARHVLGLLDDVSGPLAELGRVLDGWYSAMLRDAPGK